MSVDSNRLRFAFRDWQSLLALKVLREKIKSLINRRFEAPSAALSDSETSWLRIWQSIFENKASA